MDRETVTSLFELFTGAHNGIEYYRIIDLAIYETGTMLRPDAERTDARLNFLSAAIAFYRLQQILAARERAECTYAGKVLKESQNTAYDYSKRLLRDYFQLCRDLLYPKTFIFSSFSSGEDVN